MNSWESPGTVQSERVFRRLSPARFAARGHEVPRDMMWPVDGPSLLRCRISVQPMSQLGLGCAKTPAVAPRVEISAGNCIPESQIILHTPSSMRCWRIVFSTFCGCMSFYTGSVSRVDRASDESPLAPGQEATYAMQHIPAYSIHLVGADETPPASGVVPQVPSSQPRGRGSAGGVLSKQRW